MSKDLHVLRRAAEVYQGLIERSPRCKHGYAALLNEWAVGFYTELDFANEAENQRRSRELIMNQEKVKGVYVPMVYDDLCTRRVLVTEWIDGVKLSDCPKEEIAGAHSRRTRELPSCSSFRLVFSTPTRIPGT